MKTLEISDFDLVYLSDIGKENFINRKLKENGFDLEKPIERIKDSFKFIWIFKQEENG